MYQQKLNKAPLQEVIFEMFWKLPLDESGFPNDPGFQLAQGVFDSKILNYFPVRKKLVPDSLNLSVYPLLVYQFWKDELTWPVVQFGPGILTLNDTEKNYIWKDNFLLNIEKAIQILQSSYQFNLQIERVRLQYIDAVEYDGEQETATDFMARNMNIVLKNNYPEAGSQKSIDITQSFQLENDSILQLRIQNGVHNKTGNPAILWTTAVEKTDNLDFESLFKWLEYAHKTTSETFMNMLNPDFYANFNA